MGLDANQNQTSRKPQIYNVDKEIGKRIRSDGKSLPFVVKKVTWIYVHKIIRNVVRV